MFRRRKKKARQSYFGLDFDKKDKKFKRAELTMDILNDKIKEILPFGLPTTNSIKSELLKDKMKEDMKKDIVEENPEEILEITGESSKKIPEGSEEVKEEKELLDSLEIPVKIPAVILVKPPISKLNKPLPKSPVMIEESDSSDFDEGAIDLLEYPDEILEAKVPEIKSKWIGDEPSKVDRVEIKLFEEDERILKEYFHSKRSLSVEEKRPSKIGSPNKTSFETPLKSSHIIAEKNMKKIKTLKKETPEPPLFQLIKSSPTIIGNINAKMGKKKKK